MLFNNYLLSLKLDCYLEETPQNRSKTVNLSNRSIRIRITVRHNKSKRLVKL